MAELPARNPFANYYPETRGQIVGLHRAGLNPQAIRDVIGCNIKTVYLWINRYEAGGDEALKDHRKHNKGVKRTTPDEDDEVCEIVEEFPFVTAPEILAETQLNICDRTVHRRLKSMGLTAHRPEKKEPLTAEHRAERLQFARDHLEWQPEQWANVIWSDEKVFRSSDDGRRHVYRPRGRQFKLDPRYVVPKQHSGRITCGFWGCMSSAGLMELVEISPRMDSEEYVEILENIMLPCARARFPINDHPVIYFVQDNSAVHTSRMTRDWFDAHPDVIRIEWPRKSPDFNPIENIWSLMVKNWRSGQDRTRDELTNHVFNVWDEISTDPEVTLNLVNSMNRRMQCAIENNGYWIDY